VCALIPGGRPAWPSPTRTATGILEEDPSILGHKTIYGIGWHGTQVGNERVRVLDQNRDLVYLQYHGQNLDSFFERAKVSLSCQKRKAL